MKKIGMLSLGCAKNLVDSEMMLAMFDKSRYALVNDPKEADLIIVNTCGFIASAKEESINAILEMATYGKKLVVTGCLAQRYTDELRNTIPEADMIIPISEYANLNELFAKVLGDEKEGIAPLNPLKREISTPDYCAYLRISEGCNNFCSFCAIPYIRGRFVSRPYDEIIEEAKLLKEKGIKEISVISQDTMHYGCDFAGGRPNIVDLMKELDGMGFYSIRLLYLYPEEIPDEMIDLIANSKSIKHYFDIPVQCASDHLLKLMNRHGTKEEMMRLFKLIKEKVPDAILRTTLIAGFPGETEEDFKETMEFLDEVRFDHMGCFAYSREEGTAGYKMKNQVPDKLKEERRALLMGHQRKISYERNRTHIGEVMEGIVIKVNKDGEYTLRSSWNAPDEIDGNIYFKSKRPLKSGDIVKVKITNAFVYDLMGEEVI